MNEKIVDSRVTAGILILACSGAADVGAVADQTARKLSQDGIGKMHCLAGVGGRVTAMMEPMRSAARILVIDGCHRNCAQTTLDQAGIKGYTRLNLMDLGMKKGETPVTAEAIEKAAAKGTALLFE